MFETKRSAARPVKQTVLVGWVSCLLVISQGCGESQQDLFLKHAQRDRGGSTDEPADPTPAANKVDKQPTPQIASRPTPPVTETSVATPETGQAAVPTSGDSAEDLTSVSEAIGIAPVTERAPETALSVAERRRRAFSNLQKLNDALITFLNKNGYYPRSYATNEGGVPTLSWRVELLPYLGYDALYKKFDFTRAWNMSPNKELLEFIPDEYVSPERFDDKTNYQLAADQMFIFGENRAIRPSMIDDGPENTIMLVEVNDDRAVPWTQPKDFAPDSLSDIDQYLGNLRVDGTFALWANGFPVLLEKNLSKIQLIQAMTYKKSDGARASEIHRAITVEEAESDPTIGEKLATDQVPEDDTGAQQAAMSLDLPQMADDLSVKREPIPSAVDLTAAQDKLRVIFRDKFLEAKSPDDKGKLAGELLDTAQGMESDPAGAFALQKAALRLAVESADGGVLIRAIDQRVARFEVDSFQENLTWIQEFSEETASRDSSTVKGDDILKRAIPVIYSGISQDEYMMAASVARIANRFTGNARDDKLARLLTRLRVQLGTAKREYEKSVDHLHRYRINPEDHVSGAAFGTFSCFIKGDWQTGLKLIADSKGSDLVEVARMDLRGATRPIDQVAIGDAWWDLSRRGSGAYRQGAEDRAVMWYTQALERLPDSLDRIHVENRLKEADESDGRSPIALCIQLAEELNIDLGQSLTSIAAKGIRGTTQTAAYDKG